MTSRLNRRYGWRPQLPDHRDRVFRPAIVAPTPTADLRALFPAPYDQGQLGSCTANAISGAIQCDMARQKLEDFMPSRLFIYYNERAMEGTIDQDAGANIRDGIKSINVQGVCPETEWPYDESKFADRPPANCYADATKARSLRYQSVDQDLALIKASLAQQLPVVIGFTVYESFESDAVAANGVVPMPANSEKVLGGHAVDIAGVNDTTAPWSGIPPQYFLMRNSWGTGWGVSGYFFMPFAYVLNQELADDFWVIQSMA